jgi:hypothetical protein
MLWEKFPCHEVIGTEAATYFQIQVALDKQYFVLAIRDLEMTFPHHSTPFVLSYDVLYIMEYFANNFVEIITESPTSTFRTIVYKVSMRAPINKREIMSGFK